LQNFIRFLYKNIDFETEWIFRYITGKGACDGVSGTVVQLVSTWFHQRIFSEQIFIPQAMFEFFKRNINGISFIFVSMNDIQENSVLLEERFNNAKLVSQEKILLYSFQTKSNKMLRDSVKNNFMQVTS